MTTDEARQLADRLEPVNDHEFDNAELSRLMAVRVLREQADEIDRLRGDHQSLMESFVAMERRAVVAEAALTEQEPA